jgi:lysophospholipase L1-like esterase
MRITDDEYGFYHCGIEEYARNVGYIIAKLSTMGTRVIACTLPPFDMSKMNAALDGWHILFKEEGRSLYDEAIINAAGAHGAILVDMRGVYAGYDAADLTIEDGLHLNGKGQTLLATHVFAKIAGLIGT